MDDFYQQFYNSYNKNNPLLLKLDTKKPKYRLIIKVPVSRIKSKIYSTINLKKYVSKGDIIGISHPDLSVIQSARIYNLGSSFITIPRFEVKTSEEGIPFIPLLSRSFPIKNTEHSHHLEIYFKVKHTYETFKNIYIYTQFGEKSSNDCVIDEIVISSGIVATRIPINMFEFGSWMDDDLISLDSSTTAYFEKSDLKNMMKLVKEYNKNINKIYLDEEQPFSDTG